MKGVGSKVSRRSLLVGTAGVISAPMVISASRAIAKSNSLTMTSAGGSYQGAHTRAVLDPFTEETGIKVEIVPLAR